MDNTKWMFIALFTVIISMTAQEQSGNEFYTLDRITSLTQASPSQSEKVDIALLERKNKLSAIDTNTSTYSIDKSFHDKIVEIFSQEQLSKLYTYKMNTDAVNKWAVKRLNNIANKDSYPEKYLKMVQDILYDFEYKKEFIKQRYFYDKETKTLELNKAKKIHENWTLIQKKTYKDAVYAWSTSNSKCNSLQNSYKPLFTNYHFYLGILSNQNFLKFHNALSSEVITIDLQGLINLPEIKGLEKHLINCEIQNIMNFDKRLQKLDSIPKKRAQEKLYTDLQTQFTKKIAALAPLLLKGNWELRSAALEVGVKSQKLLEIQKELDDIKTKAKEAGLDDGRIQELVDLVLKKNSDIEALKKKKETNSSFSDLFQDDSYSAKKEILAQFGRDIANLISKKEFAGIFKKKFKKITKTKTLEQLKQLETNYKFNEEQLQKLKQLVSTYYLNEAVNKTYYKHNKTLLKQKQGALRFRFEKDYKKLMESFDVKIENNKNTDSRKFKW